MPGVNGRGHRWLKTDRTENVPPRFQPVVFRIGFACERAETHGTDPKSQNRSNLRAKTRLGPPGRWLDTTPGYP
jgi:hypothetical protein